MGAVKSVDELLLQLGALDIKLAIDGERLYVSAPKGSLTPDLRAELAGRKPEIMAFLAQVGSPSAWDSRPIQPVPRGGPLPLSFAQGRLWFLDQFLPGSSAYNVPAAYRLEGSLDWAALERAINEVVRRHEVLRTTFAAVDGEAVQVIAPFLRVALPLVDLRSLPPNEREPEALRRALLDASAPFDLSRGPLLRARLLRLGDEEQVLVVTMHHIVTDGWSEEVFRRELAELYTAFSQGRASALPELPVQYADFSVWQRRWLESGALAPQLAYWRERLEGAVELQLPTDRPRPALQTFDGAQQAMSLSRELSSALKALSRREGATLFMTLLAAFQVLLYRYTGQEDIMLGTPIANRDRAEIEGLIGLFVNTLVLRTDLSGTPPGTLTFRELLARVREVCLGAYAHQHLPFEKVVEEVQPQRDLSRNPLFQVMFALQNAPRAAMEMAGLTVTPLDLPESRVRIDLECHLWEEGEAIRGALVYNTSLYDAATIARMAAHYRTLLEGIAADPEQRVSELPLLTDVERQQILVGWNNTAVAYPQDRCVHELFEEQVARTPEAMAVCYGDQSLTYAELNMRANQLAHYLQKRGVGCETLVGICVERTPEMVVGLLGILKAGGAYVPLDPTYPQERLAFILRDTRASVVVTQGHLLHKYGEGRAKLVCLDREREAIARESAANPPNGAPASRLIYVMYTSGTTGQPKGVTVTHRAVVRLVRGGGYAQFGGEVFLQLAPLAFDASTFEIWGPLLNGARLEVMGVDRPSLAELGQALKEGGVTTLWLTAGLFHAMVEEQLRDLEQLHQLLAGGDVLSPLDVASVVNRLPAVRMINGYGPTEGTTFSLCYAVPRPMSGSTVPIGRPIGNTQAYILDGELQPVPVGVTGELYLGGAGLARGYLNDPELTAEKFVPDPLGAEAGGRLYRTGDLTRYLPDGNIEFLGRMDRQVKIRGFRVEPAEIEAVLRQHPGVRDCVVVVREDPGADKRLVAYVVAFDAQHVTSSELRLFLEGQLPGYLVPSAMLLLEALPLTPSGKVDRAALPAPGQVGPELEKAFVAPRDELEGQLVRIWEEVLGVRPVGMGDSFFDLGGHSLLGIHLFARIEKELGKKLPVALLFQSATVERLAQVIRGDGASPHWSTLVPIQIGGARPPFFCVHGFGGGVLGYAELARLLGPEQPFFGLQAKGLDGREEPEARIEDMAAHYLRAVRTVQAEGPYYVGGYCYGGVVAFEMARQLRAQGEQVALLAVLEGYALRRSEAIKQLWRPRVLARFVRNLPCWLRDVLQQPGAREKWAGRLRGTLGRRGEAREWDADAGRVMRGDVGDETDISPPRRRLIAMHLQALKSYKPQIYPGRLTLFRVRTLSLFRSYDPELGWGRLAGGGVEVRMVPGAHYNMLEQPHVATLAAKLKESLEGAREQASLVRAAGGDQGGP